MRGYGVFHTVVKYYDENFFFKSKVFHFASPKISGVQRRKSQCNDGRIKGVGRLCRWTVGGLTVNIIGEHARKVKGSI